MASLRLELGYHRLWFAQVSDEGVSRDGVIAAPVASNDLTVSRYANLAGRYERGKTR